MNILISVSYYAPHISGLTNSIKNLAQSLAGKGHKVHVITTQHAKNLALEEVINGVKIYRVPYLLKLQKGFIMPLYLFSLMKEVWKSDSILINLPQPEGIFAAVMGRLFGKRVVSVYACEIVLPQSLFSSVIESVLSLSHFVTLFLSHKVVVLSDDYAKHAKLLSHFTQKIVEIYPYIQKPMIKSKQRQDHEKKYRIGFVGRISSEKGLEYLLETVPLLKNKLGETFVILIAGPKAVGEELYVEKIGALAKDYKENVLLLPALTDDEMGAFYANLDVLVLPSINSTEAFGMVQVEAMFCGTPVVSTDLPGVRIPILKTGMGEIAKKKDSNDLAEKIVKVLKNREAYVTQKKMAEEIFNQNKIVEKYEKLVTSLPR